MTLRRPAGSVFSSPAGASLAASLDRGATVCAATQRLARALHLEWINRMRGEGREVWPTPDILPISAWLQRIARAHSARRAGAGSAPVHFLDEQQEQFIWEQAALAAGVLDGLLQPQQIASAMMDAHAIARAWDIPLGNETDFLSADAAAFRVTFEHAEMRWRQLDAAPAALLPWRAVDAVRDATELLPREIVFIGFDLDADAAFTTLIRALETQGVVVRLFEDDAHAGVARMIRHSSFEDELYAAALWCRQLLDEGVTDIGVVIPHLDTVRPAVERVFADVLQPRASRQPESEVRSLFELSLGPRAIDEPLIAAAFMLLEIARPTLPLEHWTRVLHSPFVGGSSSHGNGRAILDAVLRRIGMRTAGVPDVLKAASHAGLCEGDPFLAALRSLPDDRARRSATEWSDVFSLALDALGWPGDRTLTSREFQARARFDELLGQFAALDVVSAPFALVEAITRFRHMAATRVFQVKSVAAPVQIMGVRETAGLRFSHCRVLGMNDDIWPPMPRPAAFIPIWMQRRAGIPAASSERFLAQVRRQTEQLLHCAPEVIFTCSNADGDRELLPSPLLSDLAIEDEAPSRTDTLALLGGTGREKIEHMSDDRGPAVDDEEDIRGGTGVLTLQSACPFRAFATFRLHADRPEAVEHGVRLLDRGSLVHDAMEHIWENLRGHRRLVAVTDAELRKYITRAVDDALERQSSLRGRRLAAHLIAAERECLQQLLYEWMDVERQRTAFTVEAHEQRVECVVAGLRLFVRADRIDRLGDGSIVLLDYKTGKKSPRDWMTERPAEPQLPLYVHAMGEDVRVAGYAVIRRGECGIAGLRDDAADAPEFFSASEYLERNDPALRDWTDLRAQWSAVLERLATEFMGGEATVDPRDGGDTCRYCDLATLCRVHDTDEREEGENAD